MVTAGWCADDPIGEGGVKEKTWVTSAWLAS